MSVITVDKKEIGLSLVSLLFNGAIYIVDVDDPREPIKCADWESAQLWFDHVCNVVESEYAAAQAEQQIAKQRQVDKLFEVREVFIGSGLAEQIDPFADLPEPKQVPTFETMPDFEW